jgi:hypothetical protein
MGRSGVTITSRTPVGNVPAVRRRLRALITAVVVVALLVGMAVGERHIVRDAVRPAPVVHPVHVVPAGDCAWVGSTTM